MKICFCTCVHLKLPFYRVDVLKLVLYCLWLKFQLSCKILSRKDGRRLIIRHNVIQGLTISSVIFLKYNLGYLQYLSNVEFIIALTPLLILIILEWSGG